MVTWCTHWCSKLLTSEEPPVEVILVRISRLNKLKTIFRLKLIWTYAFLLLSKSLLYFSFSKIIFHLKISLKNWHLRLLTFCWEIILDSIASIFWMVIYCGPSVLLAQMYELKNWHSRHSLRAWFFQSYRPIPFLTGFTKVSVLLMTIKYWSYFMTHLYDSSNHWNDWNAFGLVVSLKPDVKLF